MRGRLRFVAVVLLVATAVAVPVTASASAPVPHGAGPPFLAVPSPNPPGATYSVLDGVSCTSTTNCFAVGSSGDGSVSSTLIERWNGTSWAIIPSPNPTGATDSALNDVSCTSITNCFAVGTGGVGTLVERWDGTSWAIVPSPNPTGEPQNVLTDVSCVSATSCFAVGWFGHTFGPRDTLFETLVERWNGTSWAIVPSPNPIGSPYSNLFGVSCTSATNCFAVGFSGSNAGPPFSTLIERWDGTSWAIVPSPNPSAATSSHLYGVSCSSTDSCFAVGYFVGSTTFPTLVERWDGTSWAIVPSPISTGALNDVSCTSTTNCLAVGSPNVERWNGTSWGIVPSGNPTGARGGTLLGVSCTNTRSCFAVGYRGTDSGAVTLVERRR